MKTILITGASGNLGYAVTQKLIGTGHHVIAIDATTPRDSYLNHSSITTVQLDLSAESAVTDFVRHLDKDIDAAILTVGGFAMGGFEDTDLVLLRKMFTLNFETAYHLVRHLLPGFKKRGTGQFILIGARPALDAAAGKDMLAYALSKKLVFALSEVINAETAGSDIHSTVIVPSTIDTPANRKSMPDADPSKWVTAESLAETIVFLIDGSGQYLRESLLKMYNAS